ncbi:MAG: ABC transporter permease [Blastocatellia bacterium]|nr:ABC transporter permease [Blastocatellia bacterium]
MRFRFWLWLIALIGVIVPQRLRADWRQEWEAELHYRETMLADWDKLNLPNKLDLLRRSVGAFWDALWLQPQRWEDEMLQDLRYGVRMLGKHKGFTLIAVMTLALGIGANTTVFSLINAVLLKPISGREPEQLVGIYSQDTKRTDEYRSFSHPNYTDLRAQRDVFEDVLAISFLNAGVTEGEMTRSVTAVKISANYFSVFGVQLAQGRTFLPEEETQPAPVAIVSYRWWQQHGAQSNLIGQSMRVNGRVVNIVGIAPQGFTGTNAFFSPDLFMPLSFALPENKSLQDRSWHDLMIVGRLRQGVTMEAVNARLQVVSKQLADAYASANHDQLLTIAPLPRMAISTAPSNDRAMIATIGVLAQGLSSLVLLIACLNLANMLLARGAARRKEFAVRQALGARAGRLVRQLLTEGFLLALLGGLAGIVLAAVATERLIGWMLQMVPFSFDFNPWPDVRVLGATLGFSLLATLFFALGPALKTVRFNLNAELKESAGTNMQASRRRLFATRHVLVMGQIALSLCLLVAAGLASRGAIQAIGIHPGFDLDRGFYLRLDGSLAGYTETEVRQLYRRVTERVSTLPGVEAASLSLCAPFGELVFGQRVQQGGMPFPPPASAGTPAQGKALPANYNVIGADYFRTLGITLLQGREFRSGEFTDAAAPQVAIISASLAEKLWPGESAMGRTIQFAGGSDADNRGTGGYIPVGARPQELFEVVGIVPPFKDELLRQDDSPKVFLPYAQHYFSEAYLNVRALPGANVDGLIRVVREEVHRLDPTLPMLAAKSMRFHFTTSVGMWLLRMGAILFAIFGSVALLLSLIGVYGVNAFMVARRTREIGIRMALGADRRNILRLLLREGVLLTSLGLGFGLVLAGFVAWAMRGILFSVSPFDPLVFGAAIAVLAAAALLACYLPARRATKVDPLIALRQE